MTKKGEQSGVFIFVDIAEAEDFNVDLTLGWSTLPDYEIRENAVGDGLFIFRNFTHEQYMEARELIDNFYEEARESVFTQKCTICGKDLYDGEEAYATTTGLMDVSVDGFSMGDLSPWLTVACKECGEKVSELIFHLQTREVLKE